MSVTRYEVRPSETTPDLTRPRHLRPVRRQSVAATSLHSVEVIDPRDKHAEVAARPIVVFRRLLFLFVLSYLGSMLLGNALLEQAHRTELRALARTDRAEKKFQAAVADFGSLTRVAELESWTFENGFVLPDESTKRVVVVDPPMQNRVASRPSDEPIVFARVMP